MELTDKLPAGATLQITKTYTPEGCKTKEERDAKREEITFIADFSGLPVNYIMRYAKYALCVKMNQLKSKGVFDPPSGATVKVFDVLGDPYGPRTRSTVSPESQATSALSKMNESQAAKVLAGLDPAILQAALALSKK